MCGLMLLHNEKCHFMMVRFGRLVAQQTPGSKGENHSLHYLKERLAPIKTARGF